MKQDNPVDVLLISIDRAFDRQSWHGTNLRGSVRGLSAKDAARRPAPGRNSIWELVLHCAYWKYTVRRRMLDERKGSFERSGSNWLKIDVVNEKAWKKDINLLIRTHDSMREALAQLKPEDLWVKPPGSKVDNFTLLSGICAHDLYHAGQIQLIKRLIIKKKPRSG